ncbi:MAG: hypothetical protein ACR2RL_22315 [Gammaproteobacteria bacterium]
MSTVQNNPYAAPTAKLENTTPATAGVTEGLLLQLRGTRGWVRFIAIVLLVVAAFTLLAALAMIGGMVPAGLGSFGFVLAGLYLMGTVFYAVLGIYLFRYASAIGRALTSRAVSDVMQALGLQRRFWRAASILALIGCVIGVISVPAAPMLEQYLERAAAISEQSD